MVSVGYGLREVIVDQHFSGKWSDVDLNPGGGHGTFHGTKSSDSAGGFSYKSLPSPKQIMQNRFIYWRILGDTLELTESSLDYNLENNQIRYIFRDTPIVGPISIHEDEHQIVILVATVTSVNRFNFIHPNKLVTDDIFRNKLPSLFNQMTNRPLMTFKGFNLSEHTINVPVPTTVSSHVLPHNSGYIFALSYESGAVSIAKISKDDTLCLYDLRQSNLFTRLLSFTSSMRTPAPSTDAVVGLSFFIGKLDHTTCMYLVTLSMNGRLRLFVNSPKASNNEWTVLTDVLLDNRFAIDGFTDCNVVLRRANNDGANEPPKFIVFLPGVGFKIYQVLSNDTSPILAEVQSIVFREKSVMDFAATSEFLYVVISNPDEEAEWEVKSFNFGDKENPRFNLALLEPLPRQDRTDFPVSLSSKEFYLDLIFNKSSFSSSTIYNALSMFESYVCFPKYENDWELTKKFAMMVMDKELYSITKEVVDPIPEEKWLDINVALWLNFYNSCVEYHNATMKPLGLFYEQNTGMVCIVKKSRISFLRPTDFLETLYYFPHCVVVPEIGGGEPEDTAFQVGLLLKYLEIIDCIESTSDASYGAKINKRLKEDRRAVRRVFEEVANLLTEADPNSLLLERRHFVPILTSKLKDLGQNGEPAMRLALSFLSTWDKEIEVLDVVQEDMLMDDSHDRPMISEYFLGSRLGANMTTAILKQLIQHKFMIAKNTMILQSLIANLFNQNNQFEGIQMVSSFQDQNEAQKVLTHHFVLHQLCERSAEAINEHTLDTGLRIANIVNSNTVDHLVQGKLTEFWPMKLVELYCHSILGGYAIRSRARQPRNSMIVSYADAAGSSLWPTDESLSRPFEEFLIAACQYNALSKYATDMGGYLAVDKPSLKQFYQAVSALVFGGNESALRSFRSISIQQLSCDPYFSVRILKLQPPFELPYFELYEFVVQLLQIFQDTRSIMKVAEDAVRNCIEDKRVQRMCSLGFKQAMQLQDYKAAYRFIAKAPNNISKDGRGALVLAQEKSALIRTFVTQLLEKADLDTLINLDTVDEFFKLITMTDEVERVLGAQARLSDPISADGIYQMVYLYHLSRRNFAQAAAAMLERVIQLGNNGKGRKALEAQKQSYLDILNCLSFTEDRNTAFVSRYFPDFIESLIANIKKPVENFIEFFDGSKIPAPPPEFTSDHAMDVRSYDQILRECELCSALLISESPSVSPINVIDAKKRAAEVVEFLTAQYRYDHAIKLANLWDLPINSVIQAFTNACVNLLYDIAPPSGDPADYLRQLDINEIPSSNAPVVEIAFSILQTYLAKYEKIGDTSLHMEVAMELLTHDINFPAWFEDSFKKRDVSRLLMCYINFGDWSKATDLAIQVMDASLGRRNSDDFDLTVQKVTALSDDPILPYTAINTLANQIYVRLDREPTLRELFDALKSRCDDYVVRVLETRKERRFLMMSSVA